MPWIDRQQRRIYCFEAGKGRSVVLLHGMALAGIAWSPQDPALVDAGFRVLVPDMAGHGASDAPDRKIGVSDLVGDLGAIIDAHDLAQADLVGVSMGGTTALAPAAMDPSRVRRLVNADMSRRPRRNGPFRTDRRVSEDEKWRNVLTRFRLEY